MDSETMVITLTIELGEDISTALDRELVLLELLKANGFKYSC
jgi:hypothetical protein